jgi:hypothetical protein
MTKMLPVIGMAIALGLVLGVEANALDKKLEKLLPKLEKIETIEKKGGGATITNPEPSTILLLGTGLAAFGVWRWRKRQ